MSEVTIKRPLGKVATLKGKCWEQGDLVEIIINDNQDTAIAEVIAIELTPNDKSPLLLSFKHFRPDQILQLQDDDNYTLQLFEEKLLEEHQYDPKDFDFSPYINADYGWCQIEGVVRRLTELETYLMRLEHDVATQP